MQYQDLLQQLNELENQRRLEELKEVEVRTKYNLVQKELTTGF